MSQWSQQAGSLSSFDDPAVNSFGEGYRGGGIGLNENVGGREFDARNAINRRMDQSQMAFPVGNYVRKQVMFSEHQIAGAFS